MTGLGLEVDHSRALRRYGLDEPALSAVLDGFAEQAALTLGAPVGLVCVVQGDALRFLGRWGMEAVSMRCAGTPCAFVAASGAPLLLADTAGDPRFAGTPFAESFRFYAGAPVVAEDGIVVGTLCVADRIPREGGPNQLAALRSLTRLLMDQLETRRELLRARRFQQLHESSPALVVAANFDGYFEEVSRYWTDVLGYSRADLTALPFQSFVHPDDRDRTAQALGVLSTGGEVAGFENRYVDARGEVHWFRWYARGDAVEGRCYAVAHDVTDYRTAMDARDEAERELRATTRLLAAVSQVQEWHIGGWAVEPVLVELCRAAAELTGSQGAFVVEARWGDGAWLASDRALAAWGQAPSDLRGLLESTVGAELKPVLGESLIVALRRDSQLNGFLGLVGRRSGYAADDLVFVAPLIQSAASLLVARQESARRAASEQAIRESELWFRALAQFAPLGIFRTDAEGRVIYANPKLVELLEVDVSTPTEQWPERVEPDDRLRVTARWAHALAKRTDLLDELRLRPLSPGEEPRTLLLRATPIGSLDGRLLGFVGMAVDITDRKRVERLQQEFIATVSHELRTPLTSIRGALGLLSSGLFGEVQDTAREMVSVALTNSERLIRLVADILDIERVQSGALDVVLAPIDLGDVVRRAARDLAGFATQLGVRLALSLSEPLPTRGDTDRLVQVFSNLLSNAAKFSPQGAEVQIRGTSDGQHVRVIVTDSGPGVPATFLPRLFDRFARADNTDARRHGGSGLGLAISKAIVKRHGGELEYQPVPSGGACFVVTLLQRNSAT